MKISLFDRVENSVVKGENGRLAAYSPFLTVFSKAVVSFTVYKSWYCATKNWPFPKQIIYSFELNLKTTKMKLTKMAQSFPKG